MYRIFLLSLTALLIFSPGTLKAELKFTLLTPETGSTQKLEWQITNTDENGTLVPAEISIEGCWMPIAGRIRLWTADEYEFIYFPAKEHSARYSINLKDLSPPVFPAKLTVTFAREFVPAVGATTLTANYQEKCKNGICSAVPATTFKSVGPICENFTEQHSTTKIGAEGGTAVLEGVGNVTFPPNSLKKTTEVKLSRMRLQELESNLTEQISYLDLRNPLNYYLVIEIGEEQPAADYIIGTMQIPENYFKAAPKDLWIYAAAWGVEGSDEEWHPFLGKVMEDFNAKTRTVTFKIPASYFQYWGSNSWDGNGPHRTMVTLAYQGAIPEPESTISPKQEARAAGAIATSKAEELEEFGKSIEAERTKVAKNPENKD